VEKEKFIWMDGKLVPWDQAQVHVLTHTLHYGSGVFEGMRCYDTERGPAVFRMREHLQRLYDSAHILMMDIPYSLDEMAEAVKETIRANELRECYIRPLVHRGYGMMGVNPLNSPVVVSIAVWKWGAYLGEEGLTRGIRVKISSFCRSHIQSLPTKAKATGNYLNSIMAKMEALKDGYNEALLLDTEGCISEGSGENVFVVIRGRIYTPGPKTILMGITRDTILNVLGDTGKPVIEATLTRDQLYMADEAFFTGTAAELTPIREVDHRTIGKGGRGPITHEVQKKYFEIVRGKDPKYRDWCELV
jgi:branched-chain amino acid aminotransferase